MADAVREDPIAKTMLRAGNMEVSYFTDINGVKVKCRPDWTPTDYQCLVDLKFMAPRWASPAGFCDALQNFGYFRAAAFYMDIVSEVKGVDMLDYFFVVCEKEEPFDVVVYSMDPRDKQIGRESYNALLSRLNHYRLENHWPGYFPDSIYEASMSKWSREKERSYHD